MEVIRFSFARCWRILLLAIVMTAALSACGSPARRQAQENAETAKAMWQELCKQSGKKIYRTVENVEGVYLLKIRKYQSGELQSEYDPYGRDYYEDAYIRSFLKKIHDDPSRPDLPKYSILGYNYVEAIDPKDGKRYRYTGRWVEPWATDKNYLKGYMKFIMDKNPAASSPPRYGIIYEDITTPEQRRYWIAGSSLRVIDMQTNETIAERIGYMVDLGQGNNSGGRRPWFAATHNACPSFYPEPSKSYDAPPFAWQSEQTHSFVASVLNPLIH